MVRVPSHVLASLDRWTSPASVCVEIPFAHPQPILTLVTDTYAFGWGAHLGSLQTMVHRRLGFIHQHQRAESCQIGVPSLFATYQGKQPVSPHKQHSSNVLPQQAGRSTLFSLSRGNSALGALHCQLDRCRKILPSGGLKQSIRPPEHIIYKSPCVVSPFRCLQIHLSLVRVSPSRPVCDKYLQKMAAVLFPVRSQPGFTDRHILTSMVRQALLCFPPVLLIHRVLLKIKQDQARVILIASAGACQHLFSTLLAMSAKPPISLPLVLDRITQDHGRLLHLSLQSLQLTAWILHG